MSDKFLKLDEKMSEKVICKALKDCLEDREYDLSLEDILFNREIIDSLDKLKKELMDIKYKVVM